MRNAEITAEKRQEQRIQHPPELAEHRVEVLRLEFRPGQVNREAAPLGHRAPVRPQRRQPVHMRLMDREQILGHIGVNRRISCHRTRVP
jgi:hypothetical protein